MELLSLPAAGGLIRLPSRPSLLQDTRNPPVVPTKNAVSSKSSQLTASFRFHKNSSPYIRASSSSSSYPPVAEIFSSSNSTNTGWVVTVEAPPNGACSKSEVVDYYVSTLAKVLGSAKEAQMCIYNASWQPNFCFCCDIDEETSRQLASLPGVLSVKPDQNFQLVNKDTISSSLLGDPLSSDDQSSKFSPGKNSEFWLVRMEKPGVQIVTKAQAVDYYAHTLTKVLRNEKDAQVSIYHISWEKNFGFCCHIDAECARDLAGVPGVLSVHPDANHESENKNYGGEKPQIISDPSETSQISNIKTKRLFVTGLSFYTSEKTLRAAFEGYGELVEVKVIMDKISKRSKGYAFLEYTTEEAAGAALKEMNGKIINGWMIVVDVAKTNPPRYSTSRGRSRFSNPSTSPS